jgi:hypothetical protein
VYVGWLGGGGVYWVERFYLVIYRGEGSHAPQTLFRLS